MLTFSGEAKIYRNGKVSQIVFWKGLCKRGVSSRGLSVVSSICYKGNDGDEDSNNDDDYCI